MARKYTWAGLDPQQEESIANTRAQEEARTAVGRQMVTAQAATDAALAELLAERNTETDLFASGTGSPEGAVTGAVGAIYVQTDGANGKTLWKKRTGTGNTGWELVAGNSGEYMVSDYGALPSASASVNRAAIQAAMDAMPANGGDLVFDYGNYNVDNRLVIPAGTGSNLKPIRFKGKLTDMANSIATSITLTTHIAGEPLFEGRGTSGTDTNLFMGAFENIALLGPGKALTSDGIRLYRPTGCRMFNTRVSEFRYGLFGASFWYYSDIEFCRFWNNQVGIFGNASSAFQGNGSGIRKCSFSGNDYDVDIDYFGENIYLEGNWFESTVTACIRLRNGRHVVVRGNYFEMGAVNALSFTSETVAGQNCTVTFEDNFVECGGAAGAGAIVNIISSDAAHNVDIFLKGNNVAIQDTFAVPTHLVSCNQATSHRIWAPGGGATYRTVVGPPAYRALTMQSGGKTFIDERIWGAGQLQFPATQNASSDVNTLDDYEEGTFTPSISSGFTTPTYSSQTGRYTKIGNVVHFHVGITVSGGTRNASQVVIAGLPFTSEATYNWGATWAYAGGVVAAGTPRPGLYINSNNTTIALQKTDSNDFVGTDLASATPTIVISGTYRVA